MKRREKWTAPMNIAVFGDLHGRVLLPFHLINRWEQEHGERIHAALCVGDVGVFRSFKHMDKSSQRWTKRHPEELGFSKIFLKLDKQCGLVARYPTADGVLESTKAKLYFVPGNHEEHQYLGWLFQQYADSPDQPLAVDRDWQGVAEGKYGDGDFTGYGRIFCLPQGCVVPLEGPGYKLNLFTINGLDSYTMPDAWSGLPDDGVQVHVMLSHEAFHGRFKGVDEKLGREGAGSPRLRTMVERIGPRYHFFGHHHWFCPEVELPIERGGVTRSVGMDQVFFGTGKAAINQGCFGILRVQGPEQLSFEVVEDEWFRGLRYADCVAFM